MEESSNQASYDIESPYVPLVTLMKKQLDNLPSLSSDCCIYIVPERLRILSENAYAPRIVSLGPYHHGKPGLKSMEEHKKRYLQDFLRRSKVSLEDYVKKIKHCESRLRNCYAKSIELSSDELVLIILVDAAFIIELLLKFNFPELREASDRMFNKPWMILDVWPDMQLIENQLPFFIIEELFDPEFIVSSVSDSTQEYVSSMSNGTQEYVTSMSNGTQKDACFMSNHTREYVSSMSNGSQGISIINLSHKFIKSLMHIEGLESNITRISKVDHFVDLIRSLCLPSDLQAGEQLKVLSTPSVTELHRDGVKLKVGLSNNLFNIRFTDGFLEIPKLIISVETWLTIKNLLAFEQCHCTHKYVNDYVFIIKYLASTPQDVRLLVHYGIVENRLGNSNEGCALIQKLAEGVIMNPSDFYFATLCEDLKKHCKSPCNKWKGSLIKHFFNSPWATKEIIVITIFLTISVAQMVLSIINFCRG